MICPPKMLPSAFACWGNTYSVIWVRLSDCGRGAWVGMATHHRRDARGLFESLARLLQLAAGTALREPTCWIAHEVASDEPGELGVRAACFARRDAVSVRAFGERGVLFPTLARAEV